MAVSKDGPQYRFVIPGTRLPRLQSFWRPPFYYGYVDCRSWFQAGFFGAEKWFRLTPAVGRGRPLSRPPRFVPGGPVGF